MLPQASPLPPGDSTVALPSGSVRIRYKASTTDRNGILVVFSGFRKKGTLDFAGTSVRPIRNDIIWVYDEFGPEPSERYYMLDRGTLAPRTLIVELFNHLMTVFHVNEQAFTFAGFSKGGSAALYYSLVLGVRAGIIVAPQLAIGSYVTAYWPRIADSMLGSNPSSSDIARADALIPNAIRAARSSETSIYLVTSEADPLWESEILPAMTALERLNNFNLIKTNSPLVTEHIDVTPYNVPVIQGLCLLTLDGITPSIPFAENGKPRNIAPQAPDSFAQTGRAMLLQTHSEGSRIFPEIDTFIVGDPVNTHGTLNRNLLVGNARFRLGSVIDKRASWRNFDKRFVDYSAAKSATLAHRGIDISDLPEGRHRVVAEISYPGNPQEVVTTEVRSKRPIGCLAVSARQHRLFFLQAAAEGTTATVVDPDTLPSHNSCVHVDVLGINASDHRLRLRGRFFPPGLIAEQWGDCEYRLMLDDGQLLTSIELGLLDRPHESLPNTLRRAYFSDMNLEGIDISGLPRRRYLLYVVAFNASVLARTRPLGILDCSNKGTSLDAITQRQSEV